MLRNFSLLGVGRLLEQLSDEVRMRVRRAQVDLLWRGSVLGYAATAAIALVLTISLSKSLSPAIGLWFGAVLIITVVRIALLRTYRALPRHEIDPVKWGWIFVYSSGAMGIAWGILSGLLFPSADLVGKTLIVITIAGIVAGAVLTNGFVAAAYYAFLVPALFPVIFQSFRDAQFGAPVGILAIMFAVFMVATARRTRDSLVNNLVSIYRLEDMAEQLNRAQHDQLTGLPTRGLLYDRLDQSILHTERSRKQLAVLFIDLDGFKELNDTLGHAAGDELLRRVAHRLKESVRAEDTVARHGGDEFVMLLGELTKTRDVETIARKLLTQIAAIHVEGQPPGLLTASVGIAFYPEDGRDGLQLIARADAAMYQAKQSGKNTFAFASRGNDQH